MELREWQYMNKPTGSTTNNSSSGFKKRFEKLIKYHIDHASSELESITKKDIKDDGFWLSEHYNNSHHEFDRDLIVSYDKDSNTFFFRIFIDGKEVDSILRNSYEDFVVAAEPYMFLPDSGTQEYNDLLTESLKEWKALNPSASSSQPASKSKSQEERYKKLIAQIDTDGIAKYKVNELTDTVLDFNVNTKYRPEGYRVKIEYNSATNDFNLQVADGTILKGNDWNEDILTLLGVGAVLRETDNLRESVGSIADDFKLYENLWD